MYIIPLGLVFVQVVILNGVSLLNIEQYTHNLSAKISLYRFSLHLTSSLNPIRSGVLIEVTPRPLFGL